MIIDYQRLHHAGNAALGQALAQTIAHELGHELILGHSHIGGIMFPEIDPFVPNAFTYTDMINILNRCKFLNHIP